MTLFERTARLAVYIAGALLLALLSVFVWRVEGPGVAAARDMAVTAQTVRLMSEQIRRDYHDGSTGLYWDVAASLEAATKSSRITMESMQDIRAHIVGGPDSRNDKQEGALPAATDLIQAVRHEFLPAITALATEATATTQDFRKDLNALSAGAQASLDPLSKTLGNIERLTADLQRETQQGGNVDKTMAALVRSMQDVDSLLADPNVKAILASSAKTSGHLAESAESLDIAMRPWRKKANQLKTILTKAAGMIKFVYAL